MENLEAYFDAAKAMHCSVEVGNVLCTRQNVFTPAESADASYLQQLAAKL
jgi:hypothetical protein